MNFDLYVPKGILQHFVESILFMSGNGTGIAFQRMNQTIIINMGTGFRVSDIYAAHPKPAEQRDTIWINGKQEIPFMLENSGQMEMYVIGVRPGMLPFLTDLPAIEANDQAVGAVNWTSPEIYNLRERLFSCATIQSGFALIENYLTGLLRQKELSGLDKVEWLGKAIHTHRVEDICRSLGVTRKKLRSEAQHFFGGSVKSLQGILRFNKTLSDIAEYSTRSLTSLHPYYDQSHFINDFKARTGITPFQYKTLCRQFPEIRYTPNFLPMKRETFLQFISARDI
jgi:AraC-like DNA-binding protein